MEKTRSDRKEKFKRLWMGEEEGKGKGKGKGSTS